jgi:hypothetical protein
MLSVLAWPPTAFGCGGRTARPGYGGGHEGVVNRRRGAGRSAETARGSATGCAAPGSSVQGRLPTVPAPGAARCPCGRRRARLCHRLRGAGLVRAGRPGSCPCLFLAPHAVRAGCVRRREPGSSVQGRPGSCPCLFLAPHAVRAGCVRRREPGSPVQGQPAPDRARSWRRTLSVQPASGVGSGAGRQAPGAGRQASGVRRREPDVRRQARMSSAAPKDTSNRSHQMVTLL